jgi:hypothetical protein
VAFTNSTFLDAYGSNLATASQYAALAAGSAAPLSQLFQVGATAPTVTAMGTTSTAFAVTVGLVLDRANDPTALLSGNWAQRQSALNALEASGGPWSTYGADQGTYAAAVSAVTTALGGSGALQFAANLGYESSAADRTIWVSLSPKGFNDLFGQELHQVDYTYGQTGTGQPAVNKVYAWTGSLTLAPSLGSVSGLWVEQSVPIPNPNVLNGTLVAPTVGPQGVGNASANALSVTPAGIAANYHFPLPGDVATGPIALVENDVNNQAGLFAAYNQYRQQVGLEAVTAEQFRVLSGTDTAGTVLGELTLDISVVAGAAPNSTQLLYSYLSSSGGTPYNAYQQVFFDSVNSPAVLTSSYPVIGQPTANSPFQWAWQQLFVDGALANVSVHMAGGDEGGSASIANGIANLANTHSSPFALIVGGTSISGLYSALSDATLTEMVTLAQQDDPATVFQLVASGLRTLPSNLSGAEPRPSSPATTLHALFETVWQSLSVTPGTVGGQPVLESAYGAHQTGSGGIASTAMPSYQKAFGLSALTGGFRGAPDVAALSSGNAMYSVLSQDYVNGNGNDLAHADGGTSAAAPLWASLTAQFNAIFNNQGLPNLGYYNDLLYIAAAIAPGSFNDVQLGNNDNSFFTTAAPTAYYNSYLGLYMTPTGQGFSAMPGYDLASGLGTPNGLLLARALSAIAHSQVSFADNPSLLDADGNGGWLSGADQSLLVQATTPGLTTGVDVFAGNDALDFASGIPGSYAWTTRLAQQALQADFDPGLALLFDRQAQGTVTQTHLRDGDALSVSIGSGAAQAVQAGLTNPFGFADFFAGNQTVRVARPVAVAETVGGQDDQVAVVRLRQVGSDSLAVTLYRVDDFSGAIDGMRPGDAGYQAAIQGRAYQTQQGGTSIGGPGYGQFGQSAIVDVDAGDLIALKLVNNSTGAVFLGFTQGNETVGGQKIAHLWNYGLNTWGFEDTWGGGDHDFNDLIVQLDFTSAYGRGWLA